MEALGPDQLLPSYHPSQWLFYPEASRIQTAKGRIVAFVETEEDGIVIEEEHWIVEDLGDVTMAELLREHGIE
jgi:hypothetical protein